LSKQTKTQIYFLRLRCFDFFLVIFLRLFFRLRRSHSLSEEDELLDDEDELLDDEDELLDDEDELLEEEDELLEDKDKRRVENGVGADSLPSLG